MSQPKTSYFPFRGGLDLETPAMSLDPGALIGCNNYECDIQGGYRRVDGYERFDGKALPSETVYHTMNFINGDTEVFYGEQIRGDSSTALGIILEVVIESGSWATNDAAGYIVFVSTEGTFVDGETITHYISEAFSSGFNNGFQ